ncbi:MAG: OB-fold domain-containing protein [Planctomycetota bacterium]
MTISEGPSILAVAARIPPYELRAADVARACGRPPGPGSRRFGSWDEDAFTLAFAAADRCLDVAGRPEVRSLLVASTTWPQAVAPQAERLATALDLKPDVETATLAGSLRGGVAALRIALGGARLPALVVAAERMDRPAGNDAEASVGDAGVAILVGHGGFARLERWTTRSEAAAWDSADVRFLQEQAARLVSGAPREGCSRAAISAPGSRLARAAAQKLGLPGTDAAMDRIGFCGAAHPLLALVEAMEGARPGEPVLWAACTEGLDAAVLHVTGAAVGKSFAEGLERATPVAEYGKWLASRRFFETEASREVFRSPAMEHRDEEHLLRLHAAKCKACGRLDALPGPCCPACGEPRGTGRVPLRRTGTVFTFTHESYVPTPWPPVTMAVVDLDGGGRILVPAADVSPEAVRIGLRVRLVLRRLHMGGGVPNYYWKAVPE